MHEGQTHRSAVWIKVTGERKTQIVFNNRVHVGPLVAHGVRCTGQEPSVDAGRVHPEARLHGGVVGVVGGQRPVQPLNHRHRRRRTHPRACEGRGWRSAMP